MWFSHRPAGWHNPCKLRKPLLSSRSHEPKQKSPQAGWSSYRWIMEQIKNVCTLGRMGTVINILQALSILSACKRWDLYLHPVAVNAWGWEIQKVQRRGERVSVMLSKGGWGGEGELKEEGRRQREGHGKGEREGSGQWLIGVLELQKWQDPRIMCEWKAERL